MKIAKTKCCVFNATLGYFRKGRAVSRRRPDPLWSLIPVDGQLLSRFLLQVCRAEGILFLRNLQ